MLRISHLEPMAQGGRRYVYVHPDDDSKVVKILKSHSKPEVRRKYAKWYKKLRSLDHFDDNIRELNAFIGLRLKPKAIFPFFPHCDGIIETDKGFAIMTDCIRDEVETTKGDVSQNMREYREQHGITPELLQALDVFLQMLKENYIITRDIHDHNLMVQRSVNGLHIIMIDGLGNSDFIPLANYVKWLANYKINRKIRRFYNQPYMKESHEIHV